jgi:hypothetical protein
MVVRYAYLVSHDVSEKGDMSRIDAHAMRLHCVLDLVDDSASRRFDAQNLGYLNNVVGGSVLADDACTTR